MIRKIKMQSYTNEKIQEVSYGFRKNLFGKHSGS